MANDCVCGHAKSIHRGGPDEAPYYYQCAMPTCKCTLYVPERSVPAHVQAELLPIATTWVVSSSRPSLHHAVTIYMTCACEAASYNPTKPCKHMEEALSNIQLDWHFHHPMQIAKKESPTNGH